MESLVNRLEEMKGKKAAPSEPVRPAAASTPLTQEERKARTRRLIQIGALTEQYLRCAGQTPEEVGELLRKVVALPELSSMLSKQKSSD